MRRIPFQPVLPTGFGTRSSLDEGAPPSRVDIRWGIKGFILGDKKADCKDIDNFFTLKLYRFNVWVTTDGLASF